MTQADLERRVHSLERTIKELRAEVAELRRGQLVLSTGITIARWLGPIIVSVAAIVVAKGG